jgi:hypothetical protein
MQTISQPNPPVNAQIYVTLARAAGAQIYRPVIVSDHGQRPAPVAIKRPTLRNTLSKTMTYAAAKGYPFLSPPDLADATRALQAELASQYNITVTLHEPAPTCLALEDPAPQTPQPLQAATVQRVCAWCGASLGSYEDDNAKPGDVSHGICSSCYEKARKEAEETVKPKPAKLELQTATTPEGTYELAVLPGENVTELAAAADAVIAESASKPGLGPDFTDADLDALFTRELTRPLAPIRPVPTHPTIGAQFYHDDDCTCERCQKASQCSARLYSDNSRVSVWDVASPSGQTYRVVVNQGSRVVTCNCEHGVHQHRATCAHAQAAWLAYSQPVERSRVAFMPISQKMHEQQYFSN